MLKELAYTMFPSKGRYHLVIFKVNLEKAFDNITWEAIYRALLDLNLPSKFIDLMRACIESPTFSYVINHIPSPFFCNGRDIRQGDPLSPYVFTIMANILCILLNESVSSKHITSFNIKSNFQASHLLYVNDLILCFCTNPKSYYNISKCLNIFYQIIGFRMNLNKSCWSFLKLILMMPLIRSLPISKSKKASSFSNTLELIFCRSLPPPLFIRVSLQPALIIFALKKTTIFPKLVRLLLSTPPFLPHMSTYWLQVGCLIHWEA